MTAKTSATESASNCPEDADRDFVISRLLNAPRELVWEAWTQPKHMMQWWGPRMITNTVCEMDVRPGGALRMVMRGPDGADYPIKGEFHEVKPPERLVFTMDPTEHPAAWHDMVDANRGSDPNPVGILVSTVTLEDQSGKTKLTVRIRLKSKAIRDNMVKMGMNQGWSSSLDRLEELLPKI